jgi:phosphoribosyl-ATP pyrophosphohydrolase
VETALAAVLLDRKSQESRAGLAGEIADLIYHLTVLLLATGVGPGEIADTLANRHTSFGSAATLEK